MLLTVKSIRIKRMNVEIFCERGVRKGAGAWGRVALFLGRSQGARTACMIVFATDVSFFVNLNFMYIFIIIFEG